MTAHFTYPPKDQWMRDGFDDSKVKVVRCLRDAADAIEHLLVPLDDPGYVASGNMRRAGDEVEVAEVVACEIRRTIHNVLRHLGQMQSDSQRCADVRWNPDLVELDRLRTLAKRARELAEHPDSKVAREAVLRALPGSA